MAYEEASYDIHCPQMGNSSLRNNYFKSSCQSRQEQVGCRQKNCLHKKVKPMRQTTAVVAASRKMAPVKTRQSQKKAPKVRTKKVRTVSATVTKLPVQPSTKTPSRPKSKVSVFPDAPRMVVPVFEESENVAGSVIVAVQFADADRELYAQIVARARVNQRTVSAEILASLSLT